jgi:hypothetical protein
MNSIKKPKDKPAMGAKKITNRFPNLKLKIDRRMKINKNRLSFFLKKSKKRPISEKVKAIVLAKEISINSFRLIGCSSAMFRDAVGNNFVLSKNVSTNIFLKLLMIHNRI